MTEYSSNQRKMISRRKFWVPGVLIVLAILIVYFSSSTSDTSSRTNTLEEIYYDEASPAIAGAPSFASEGDDFAGAIAQDSLSVTSKVRGTSAPSPIQPPIDGIDNAPLPEEDIQRIVKNGNLSLAVDDIAVAIGQITQVAQSLGGDTQSRNVWGGDVSGSQMVASMTLRVPADQFEASITQIKAFATSVAAESTSARDVTREYVDITARLTNLRAQEEQIRAFFEQATDVEDLLSIEKELSRVRGSIESIEAQRQYLETISSYSTLTISLTQEATIVRDSSWRPARVAVEAFNELVSKFQSIVDTAIHVGITALPLFLLSLIALVITYSIGRRAVRYITDKLHTPKH